MIFAAASPSLDRVYSFARRSENAKGFVRQSSAPARRSPAFRAHPGRSNHCASETRCPITISSYFAASVKDSRWLAVRSPKTRVNLVMIGDNPKCRSARNNLAEQSRSDRSRAILSSCHQYRIIPDSGPDRVNHVSRTPMRGNSGATGIAARFALQSGNPLLDDDRHHNQARHGVGPPNAE